MIESIMYSDSAERVAKTASKSLDLVDEVLDLGINSAKLLNAQLIELGEPEDQEIKELDKKIKKARKLELLKRSADKLGMKLEDLK